MIISQGFPLWVVVNRPDATADILPVIAWRYEDESSHPQPITTEGEWHRSSLGIFISTEERLAKVRKQLIESGVGPRSSEATF
jgi:hypothetical protein